MDIFQALESGEKLSNSTRQVLRYKLSGIKQIARALLQNGGGNFFLKQNPSIPSIVSLYP